MIRYAEFLTDKHKVILRETSNKAWLVEIYLISHSVQEITKRVNVETYETAYLYVYEKYINKEAVS